MTSVFFMESVFIEDVMAPVVMPPVAGLSWASAAPATEAPRVRAARQARVVLKVMSVVLGCRRQAGRVSPRRARENCGNFANGTDRQPLAAPWIGPPGPACSSTADFSPAAPPRAD